MIIAGHHLTNLLEAGLIELPERFHGKPIKVGPASIDLHLDDHILIPDKNFAPYVSLQSPGEYIKTPLPYLLHPGEMCLAASREIVHMPDDLAGYVTMRSSAGRLGLDHAMAGFIDPGFKGAITFELVNIRAYGPIKLCTGDRLVQLILHETSAPAEYEGNYNNRGGVMAPYYQ